MHFYSDSRHCRVLGLFTVTSKPTKKTATTKKPSFNSKVFTILFWLLSLAGTPGVALSIEGGYASLPSVAQGNTIDFHISTQSPTYALAVYREGSARKHMMTIPGLTGSEYNCAEQGYKTGCQWPIAYSLRIPTTWPSGVYTGEFSTGANSSDKRYILFVVLEDALGTTSPILVVLPTNTYQAYNSFGGKSLYVSKISGSPDPADQVSYDRAYHWNEGRGAFPWRSRFFVAWAEGNGYTLEYATDIDQHRDPLLLGNYSVYVGLGHHEYWSREMRDNLDNFVTAGGNAILLSGNTSFRQVRFSPDLRTMICYKNRPKMDPYALDNDPSNDYLITTEWFKSPVNYPENSTTGLGWRHGGYHNNNDNNPFQYKDGYGGYRAYRTTNWVYESSGLSDGDMIGRTSARWAILGFEVDGTLLEARNAQGALAWDANRYYPLPGALPYVVQTETTKTPENFIVLGLAPATKGHAVMGYFNIPGGGYVFNAGTTDWVRGLSDDSSIRRITANVLDRFASVSLPPSPGNLAFSASSYSVSEAGGKISISVTRTGGSQGTVTVDYTTSNDLAGAGVDYEAVLGTLTWADGDTFNKTFSVAIIDDVNTEEDETLKLALSNATGAEISAYGATTMVIIEDNDDQVNHPPVANGSTLVTDELIPANGTLNAYDEDDDTLMFSVVTNGLKGTAVITNATTGSYTYTPKSTANGRDSFTFKVNDGKVDSVPATVSVTISAVQEGDVLDTGNTDQDSGTGNTSGNGDISDVGSDEGSGASDLGDGSSVVDETSGGIASRSKDEGGGGGVFSLLFILLKLLIGLSLPQVKSGGKSIRKSSAFSAFYGGSS